MTAKNRATQIGKLHTALKKHFKPAPPSPGRPLMEHVLYASLLEDTPADLADEGFAKCEQEFFDWNEVRVTTVTELAEVLSSLPSAINSAIRLKKNLQSMFETFYNFDLDHLKKENLGKAVAKFEAMSGMTPFVLSYLIQHGLGGHAIPIDKSSMKIMWLSGAVSEGEAESGKVPGLERTIAKNKAIEFSSLLHQAGVAFQANSKDKAVWDVLLSVNKDAKVLFEQPEAPRPGKKSSKAGEQTTEAAASGKSPRSAAAKHPVPESAEKKAAKASEAAIKSAESRKAKDKALASPPKPSPPAPPKPAPLKAAAKAAAAKAAEKLTAGSKPSGKSSKPAKAAKPAAATAEVVKGADSKVTKGKEASVKASAAKEPASKELVAKPSSSKTPAAKEATTKGTPSKEPSAKATAKPVEAKQSEAKPVSKKSAPVKPVAKAVEEPAKKPSVKKPAPDKPLSSKAPVDKSLSKKVEPKPVSKKGNDSKAPAATAKDSGSTNKKLTKQKPR